jgi:hypothetical protein
MNFETFGFPSPYFGALIRLLFLSIRTGIVPEAVPLSVALAARAKKGLAIRDVFWLEDAVLTSTLAETAAEDAAGPSEESTTTIGDVMTKIPLFPGNDPDYPDSLVKKNPNPQSKKSKPLASAVEKSSTKAKDVTPALAVSAKVGLANRYECALML